MSRLAGGCKSLRWPHFLVGTFGDRRVCRPSVRVGSTAGRFAKEPRRKKRHGFKLQVSAGARCHLRIGALPIAPAVCPGAIKKGLLTAAFFKVSLSLAHGPFLRCGIAAVQ